MPDFCISLDPRLDGGRLIALMSRLYGEKMASGRKWDYPWGAVAVLKEQICRGQNVLSVGELQVAWVGELVMPDGVERSMGTLDAVTRDGERMQGNSGVVRALRESRIVDKLNGAFAMVISGSNFVTVITDPMASVQVYLGTNSRGGLAAIGTHADLVARCSGGGNTIDPVSVCDFISTGISCCPYTMHRNVVELAPGTVHTFWMKAQQEPVRQDFTYWVPPAELDRVGSWQDWENEFVVRWRKAIERRCDGEQLAVQLSGGLDSRVVLACIPPTKHCLGLTLCDKVNREVRIARRVARCYGREWIPLYRDPEYTGRTAIEATRFTGCEGEWHHAHAIGFVKQIRDLGIDSVFSGLLMDNNFKGYYARDVQRLCRWGGLLPAEFKIAPVDYVNHIHPFCRKNMTKECVEGTVERRRAFCQSHVARHRSSKWEWLDGYPYSQSGDNTGWTVERRVMPMRLPVMDRDLLELAFEIPMVQKAGARFFERAAARILGPGSRIPNANNGVRPGSGHLSMLFQRGLRKAENTGRDILAKLGLRLHVPTSWHDYPLYWRTSAVLKELRQEHGKNLLDFHGTAFSSDPTDFLRMPNLPWEIGSRLIQLAIWRSIIQDYRI